MWSPVAILAQHNFWVGANFCAALPMADPIAIYRQQQAAARAKLGEGVEVGRGGAGGRGGLGENRIESHRERRHAQGF